MHKPLYLLDAYAFIYRSYFAFIKRPLMSPAGANVSAAFGFCRFVFSLFAQCKPECFAAVFDPAGKTFRSEMYAQYKATRQKTPEDLHAQVPLVEEILKALGVPILRVDGFEADDVIATLAHRCRKEGRACWIISGDKDLLQLVDGKIAAMRPTQDFAFNPYGPAEVRKEWGVEPERILDYLSLTGDASDNVPGVKGIGDKTALKLLTEYDDLDNLYAHLEEIKPDSLRKKLEEGKESAFLSRTLITLRTDVPLDIVGLDDLDVASLNREAANDIFLREGMKSLYFKQRNEIDTGTPAGELDFGHAAPARSTKATQSAAPGEAAAHTQKPTELPPELAGKGTYIAIQDEAELARWVDECIAAGTFAFDCETDSIKEQRANLVGFSLAWQPKKACYVPLKCPEGACIDADRIRHHLSRLFNSKAIIVGHNIKYDWHVLRRFGCTIRNPMRDTMIATWLLDTDRSFASLSELAEQRLGDSGLAYLDVVPHGATFDMVPLDKAASYAAEDADFTLRLNSLLDGEIDAAGLAAVYKDVEMPLLPILGAMEACGILVDGNELLHLGEAMSMQLELVATLIYQTVGHEFNIASPKQLADVLFIERKLKTGKRTKTGYSTDSSVLEELAALDPVPEMVLKFRGLAKLKNTYIDALLPLVKESATSPEEREANVGRIHTTYIQTGAATGRLASKDPNLQNIPIREEEGRKIRNAFIATPGFVLISADYAQIELVVLAHLSQDAALGKAFRDGVDVHKRTASLLFKTAEDAVDAQQRRIAKTINFGILYGMSSFRLSNDLKIPRAQAQAIIDAYFATYSSVRAFLDNTIVQATKNGYTYTMIGRRRPIHGIDSSNKTVKQGAERMALNSPIQGTAADIVKLAMIKVHNALTEQHPQAHILLQVHDELVIEAPDKESDRVVALVRKEMESAVTLSVPLRVEIETGYSWGGMH